MKTYIRVFTAPAESWKDESTYHFIAEFSKPEFVKEFIKGFRHNEKYRKYVIVVKEVDTHRKNALEGKRTLVISTMADYLEVNGKEIVQPDDGNETKLKPKPVPTDNIALLQDTLQILEDGYYITAEGKRADLKLSRSRMEKTFVLLPEDIQDIVHRTNIRKKNQTGKCLISCTQTDSFSSAIKLEKERSLKNPDSKPVLVLNFANPVHPGGGVRRGARAQEEDLCRKSSLLLSLESQHAKKYYKYNGNLSTYMGSDAMMFTPEVEIIRGADGSLLNDSVIVAVLTCAAPMISHGLDGMSEIQYQDMVYNRIIGMLKCSAYFGYENLVLGAWGCGAFGNDAAIISDLFQDALRNFDFYGLKTDDVFCRIDFAVRGRDRSAYNYNEFLRNFGNKIEKG